LFLVSCSAQEQFEQHEVAGVEHLLRWTGRFTELDVSLSVLLPILNL
jgi:hypothetical protein